MLLRGKSRNRLLAFSMGLLTVFNTGCLSAPSRAAAPPSVDVTGVWVGGADIERTQSGNSTLSLQQIGADVIGELRASNGAGWSGAITGTVAGKQFSFQLSNGRGTTAQLAVKGDVMVGYSPFGARWYLQRQK